MCLDDRLCNAQKGCAAVFGIIHFLFQLIQTALNEQCADFGKCVAVKQLFEGGFYENAEAFAHFKDDVSGEAVCHQYVRIAFGNFASFDVADEVYAFISF